MKNFRKLKLMAMASLSVVVLVASVAFAQSVQTDQANQQAPGRQWRGKGMKRGFHRRGAFLHRLNLTDDQKAKMKTIRQSFAERNKPLHEQLRAKRQELRQTNGGGTFNEALATQKLTEMASLQAKLMGERIKLHQEMQTVLTAEQKAQLEQLKAQSKSRRGDRRGMGGQRINK